MRELKLRETAVLDLQQPQTVPSMLRNAAKLYEARNAVYGDNYRRYGKVVLDLMGPTELRTISDFNRFAIMTHIMTKLARYALNFQKGGHDDSLDDICVYAMILKELDVEHRSNGTFKGDGK